jgi:small subunit ribosomal protein S4
MARYTGAVCRLCRREGDKLFLKGERCYTAKCAMERRPYAPGQHGNRRSKVSEYGVQLRTKQKAKRIYGVLETQFRNYYETAAHQKGITGENLLILLEMRLDNVVYRAGLGRSRTEARQVVRHNHIKVNGKKVNIPSYQVKVGDVITVKEKSQGIQGMKNIIETTASRTVAEWIEADLENYTVKVAAKPERDQILIPVEETLIVELYSK